MDGDAREVIGLGGRLEGLELRQILNIVFAGGGCGGHAVRERRTEGTGLLGRHHSIHSEVGFFAFPLVAGSRRGDGADVAIGAGVAVHIAAAGLEGDAHSTQRLAGAPCGAIGALCPQVAVGLGAVGGVQAPCDLAAGEAVLAAGDGTGTGVDFPVSAPV